MHTLSNYINIHKILPLPSLTIFVIAFFILTFVSSFIEDTLCAISLEINVDNGLPNTVVFQPFQHQFDIRF